MNEMGLPDRGPNPALIVPDPACRGCDGVGYVHVNIDGDESRDWVQRCDSCQYHGHDNPKTAWDDDAAAYAATVEGRPIGFAHPVDHDGDCLHPYLGAAPNV